MLEWACAGGEPCLALLIDHDDAEREFQYVSEAGTFTETEPITDVGRPPRVDGRQHGERLGDGLPVAHLTARVVPTIARRRFSPAIGRGPIVRSSRPSRVEVR